MLLTELEKAEHILRVTALMPINDETGDNVREILINVAKMIEESRGVYEGDMSQSSGLRTTQ